jgi:tetratricopeptide (TPR) repeat protein
MARKDWAGATIHYEAILSVDPNNPLARQMLGRIGDQTKQYERAEYHYLRALTSRPQDANLLSDIGYSYLQQGRLAESKQYLLKALAIDNSHRMAKVNLAAVEAYSNNTDAALALLTEANPEQDPHQTLYELLNQSRPFEQQTQQLTEREKQSLPLAEQMRLVREEAQRTRQRREQLEELALRQRVRQAMAVDVPLSRMGRGIADDELSEMIQRIEDDDRRAVVNSGSPIPGQPERYAQGNSFLGQNQNAYPPQQPTTPAMPPYSQQQLQQQQQQQQPPQNGYGQQSFSNRPPGADGSWGQPQQQSLPQQHAPQNNTQPNGRFAAPGPSTSYGQPWNSQQTEQVPQQNWNQKPESWQGPPPAQNLQQWNGNPQMYDSLQNGQPGFSQQQNWQAPQSGPPSNPSAPSMLNNLQSQNELLYRQQAFESQQSGAQSAPQMLPGMQIYQGNPVAGADVPSTGSQPQFGPPATQRGNAIPQQSVPQQSQQFNPPNQFPNQPPATQRPAAQPPATQRLDGYLNSDGPQYAPPTGSGVWDPQGTRSSAPQQYGTIQQLSHQSAGSQPQSGHNSVRQALQLGMAAGPGLIQLGDTQPAQAHSGRQHGQSQQSAPAQQYYGNPSSRGAQPQQQSSDTWPPDNQFNQGGVLRDHSPNQTTWQGGPMPSANPAAGTPHNSDAQWHNLPAAQRQPGSSTWNHANQQPSSPMRSQNWTTPASPGDQWQSGSLNQSPTTNNTFAPGFISRPDASVNPSASTTMAGFDRQQNATTGVTGTDSQTRSRIPWTVRQ